MRAPTPRSMQRCGSPRGRGLQPQVVGEVRRRGCGGVAQPSTGWSASRARTLTAHRARRRNRGRQRRVVVGPFELNAGRCGGGVRIRHLRAAARGARQLLDPARCGGRCDGAAHAFLPGHLGVGRTGGLGRHACACARLRRRSRQRQHRQCQHQPTQFFTQQPRAHAIYPRRFDARNCRESYRNHGVSSQGVAIPCIGRPAAL